jgi:rare lipoprotein A
VFRSPVHAGPVTVAAALLAVAGCARRTAAHVPAPARPGYSETGVASWYGIPYDGRRTASGEIYDMEQLTAAHRTLPFDTWVEVTNLANGKRVGVRINDRGPFVRGRIIDLSQAAARGIGLLGPGVARVHLEVIAPRDRPRSAAAERTAAPEPPPPAPVATAGYTVQAGAFSDRERAESFRAALGEAFRDVRLVKAAGDSPLWRVLVGRQMALEAATQLAANVKEASGEAMVVPDRDR